MDREAADLRAAQALRPGGYASIPAVVAYERAGADRAMLVETALAGRALSPAVARRHPHRALDLVSRWLVERVRHDRPRRPRRPRLPPHRAPEPIRPRPPRAGGPRRPDARPGGAAGRATLPSVVEHGDLSHPNLVLGPTGELGVVDWERAEPRGLPAARPLLLPHLRRLRPRPRPLPRGPGGRLDSAFAAGDASGARAAAEDHADRLGIDPALLGPLFVACWARSTLALLGRVRAAGPVGEETAAWLASNRWYARARAVARGRMVTCASCT